jgi:hypothetical protein
MIEDWGIFPRRLLIEEVFSPACLYSIFLNNYIFIMWFFFNFYF